MRLLRFVPLNSPDSRSTLSGRLEPIDGRRTPIAMVRKLIFTAFVLAYGIWLTTNPARTAGLHSWRDCMTVKGIICIPKVR